MSANEYSAKADRDLTPPMELLVSPRLKIALVDERPLVRDSLSALLQRHAPDLLLRSHSAPKDVEEPDLSLVVIWIERGGPLGLHETIRKVEGIRQRFSRCPIAALIECKDPDVVHAAMKLGLNLIRLKTATREIILASIRLALAGGSFMSCDLLDARLADAAISTGRVTSQTAAGTPALSPVTGDLPNFNPNHPSLGKRDSMPSRLTPRELDILERVNRGMQNKSIAYELGISCCTVKVHIQNIMKKLKARNRTEVAFLARRDLAEPTIVN